jgi:hypothetical protein
MNDQASGFAAANDADLKPTLAEGGEEAMEALLKAAEATPGAVFEKDVLEALAALARDKLPVWMNLRARLKTEARDVLITELDKHLKLNRAGGGGDGADGDGLPGRPITFDEPEPWPDPVDGSELLDEAVTVIGSYMIMTPHQPVTSAVWAVHAHAHDLRDVSPPLIIKSATKRCGKTRLVELMQRLVPRPLSLNGTTVPFLERAIEEHRPTLLLDEYDALTNGDPALAERARAQLNRSFRRRSATVGKNVPLPGGGYEPRLFSTWAATLIAGIGNPPDTVTDRGPVINLKRKASGETVRPLRERDGADLDVIKRKMMRFVLDNEAQIRTIDPLPALAVDNDRAKDAWEPLLAIADIAGGKWPALARAAGKALVEEVEGEATATNIDLLLLSDIRDIFAAQPPETRPDKPKGGRPSEGPRITTKDLIALLCALEERPWRTWSKSRTPMTTKALSDRLRPYGVRSRDLWVDDEGGHTTVKGYYLKAFSDTFARYLPSPQDSTVQESEKPQNSRGSVDSDSPSLGRLESTEPLGKPSFSDSWTVESGGEGVAAKGEPSNPPHKPKTTRRKVKL